MPSRGLTPVAAAVRLRLNSPSIGLPHCFSTDTRETIGEAVCHLPIYLERSRNES